MTIPAALYDPRFWTHYTFAEEHGLDASFEVRLEVGPGYALALRADTRLCAYEFGLVAPGLDKPAELGWSDMAHPVPYALRWSETELICRALAARDPQLAHPGVPVALLCQFTAVFAADDVERAATTVDAAYARLRQPGWTGPWPTGAGWLARADYRDRSVTWHRDADGHRWATQPDDADHPLYTLRAGPDHFPHAELARLLALAADTVAAAC